MHAGTLRSATAWRVGAPTASRVGAPGEAGWRAPALRGCSRSLGGALPADNTAQPTTRVLKIRGPANLAGAWSAQPVPASRRPPRAAHRPAAARAPRTREEKNTPRAPPSYGVPPKEMVARYLLDSPPQCPLCVHRVIEPRLPLDGCGTVRGVRAATRHLPARIRVPHSSSPVRADGT